GGGRRRAGDGRGGDREPAARLAPGEHRRCPHPGDPPGLDHPPAALRGAARRGRCACGSDPHLGGPRGHRGHPVGPRPGDHGGDGSAAMTEQTTQRTWKAPSAPERLAILRRARSIAIVGASANPARASYFVGTYLLSSSPYEVYFVNPRAETILG